MANKNQLSKFIVNTDYASLKNFPATITSTIIIPAGATIPGDSYLNNQTLITPTSFTLPKGAPLQCDISYSVNSDAKWVGNVLQFVENTSLANQYQGLIFVYMAAENQIAIDISIYNGNLSSITTTGRTVVVKIRPFLPPFS